MATRLSQAPQSLGQGIFEPLATTTNPIHTIGERVRTQDGREFVYAKAGAVDLVAGTLLQSAAIVANHQNLATTAYAIGSTSVTVTLGATAATANQYANGYAVINAGTGAGISYLIDSHPAASSSATLALTLSDPIYVALDTSSKVCLIPNRFNGVVINPTTATSTPVGVAPRAVTAATYFWAQTAGPASVLADGTIVVGLPIVPSASVAGAVVTPSTTAATLATQPQVGFALQAAVTAEKRAVYLQIQV